MTPAQASTAVLEQLVHDGRMKRGKKPGTYALTAKGRRYVEDLETRQKGRLEERARIEAILRDLVAEADQVHDATAAIWAEEVLRRIGAPT